MFYSMTGAGSATGGNNEFEVSVKARSVNNRYLDISIRLSSAYADFENEIRNICREYISRGKLDIQFDISDLRDDSVEAVLNMPVINAYYEAMRKLSVLEGVSNSINPSELVSFSHAMKLERKEIDNIEEFSVLLGKVIREAMSDLIDSRKTEGKKLQDDILSRLEACEMLIESVESTASDIRQEYYDKIKERVTELMENHELDEQRLEQEVAFLVDKGDVTEEITRFRSHTNQVREMVKQEGSIGKKLDFLVQEMNREANTIGSKSKMVAISKAVIDLKSEIEKIREQVQNIE